MTELAQVLLDHLHLFPCSTVQDMLKLIYQNEFGPSHFSEKSAPQPAGFAADSLWQGHPAFIRLQQEQAAAAAPSSKGTGIAASQTFTPIGNGLVRCALDGPQTMALSTLCGLFCTTARHPRGSAQGFCAKTEEFARLCQQGQLPFSAKEVQQQAEQIIQGGLMPVGHSQMYREAYSPHYRLVDSCWQVYAPVLFAIDHLLSQSGKVTVAIDGCSGSGKSVFSSLLQQVYSCNVFHMDDFFLPPHRKTPQRLAQPGGNVDYERFAQQVLYPLSLGKPFSYQIYSCHTGQLAPSAPVQPRQLNIVEGVYSLHPHLTHYYDLTICLTLPRTEQHRRILQRSGPQLFRRFVEEWIPLEDAYFTAENIPGRCNLAVDTSSFPTTK